LKTTHGHWLRPNSSSWGKALSVDPFALTLKDLFHILHLLNTDIPIALRLWRKSMAAAKSSEQNTLPSSVREFIISFMRALNTARLYARGHDLFKKHIGELYARLREAMGNRDLLFLGCARDEVFLEGSFYPAKDPHIQKFLKFLHFLRISHVLFEKEITGEELGSFIELLAGAGQGQGEEISIAMPHDNIKHVRLGLLDYTIFSTVQSVSTQIAQTSNDEAIWRQLILQPAGAGAFNLTPEQTKQLANLCDNIEDLKDCLLNLDSEMIEKHKVNSVTHRAFILGNFIQNLGDILYGIAPIKRKLFTRQVTSILDSFQPNLKIEILGSIAPDSIREKDNDVIHEILQVMSDRQLVYLLADAIKELGVKSQAWSNLYKRALTKYHEPAVILTLVHQEIHREAQKGESAHLTHWKQLEQLLTQNQEEKQFNAQYQQAIEELETSIKMKQPMKEEEEMARLLKTLDPEALRSAKAHLIIDLINQMRSAHAETLLPPLLEQLNKILRYYFNENSFQTVGTLLRAIFFAANDHPQEQAIKKHIEPFFNHEEIRELLQGLFRKCRSYEPIETSAIDAICQLYQEKVGVLLIDLFCETRDDDNPQGRWIFTTLASFGPALGGLLLSRRFREVADNSIPRLLSLAAISKDVKLAPFVEQLMNHRNHEIRLKAISTLGHLHAERAVPLLNEIVSQKSLVKTKKKKVLQIAAATALAEIDTDEARSALQEIISQGSDDLKALCLELTQSKR
jgi:hypothetical protein